MRRVVIALGLTVVAGSGAGGAWRRCSSSSGGSARVARRERAGDTATGDAGPGSFLPEIACTDTIASIYADPGDVAASPSARS